MARRMDHNYPLKPFVSLPASLDQQGILTCHGDMQADRAIADMTWMLAVDYKAHSSLAMPWVTIRQQDRDCFTQYLEPGQSGARMVNLTGISALKEIGLETGQCTLGSSMTLLGFTPPALNKGPLLVLAPHPDDAELAAYGLYQRYHASSWIVTLTAGERQKRLDQQYLPGLDKSIKAASRRKGEIRAWNSATTPLWAGVAAERLVMLGYFNDTLRTLLKTPDQEINAEWLDDEVTPAAFRRYNTLALPSDAHVDGPRNCGKALLEDLVDLIERIRPSTVVVTHPEIDPHPDHRATAQALAQALQETQHQPSDVLLYANHLKDVRGFPRGPAYAAAGVWPLTQPASCMGPWQLFSTVLNEEQVRQKAFALHSMHDLHVRFNMDKRIKRKLARWLSQLPAHVWKDHGPHDYFQTHLKVHEVFARVDAATFVKKMACD